MFTKTENGALSLVSTGSACLNLFFKALRTTSEQDLYEWICTSWKEESLDTLKTLFYKRDCRGGSGERRLFLWGMKWLLVNGHKDTFYKNLAHIPEFGYWKDLCTLTEMCVEQPFYAELSDHIANLFATILKEDRMKMLQKEPISLSAKWAPSEGGHFDTKTGLSKKIAEKLCNGNMATYRKMYLTPMRSAIDVTERYMCNHGWGNISYSKVPSICMMKHKKAFTKHDDNRFKKWLEDVKAGVKKINASQLFPHEIVAQYLQHGACVDDVCEEQWKVLVQNVRELGKMQNCLVLSDVSGSMVRFNEKNAPINVSIALGLLISEVLDEPYKNLIVTFHEKPTFHKVVNGNLFNRVKDVKNMPWGGCTNFQAVFNLILTKAIQHHLPQVKMPKWLIVCSDMQFDSTTQTKTNWQVVKDKFRACGYETPKIIFWNLDGSTFDFPIPSDENNAVMLSGFSPSALKIILDGELPDPFSAYQKAIHSERYDCIQL